MPHINFLFTYFEKLEIVNALQPEVARHHVNLGCFWTNLYCTFAQTGISQLLIKLLTLLL